MISCRPTAGSQRDTSPTPNGISKCFVAGVDPHPNLRWLHVPPPLTGQFQLGRRRSVHRVGRISVPSTVEWTDVHVEHDVAYVAWKADGVPFRTDTFVVRNDKFSAQTVSIHFG